MPRHDMEMFSCLVTGTVSPRFFSPMGTAHLWSVACSTTQTWTFRAFGLRKIWWSLSPSMSSLATQCNLYQGIKLMRDVSVMTESRRGHGSTFHAR